MKYFLLILLSVPVLSVDAAYIASADAVQEYQELRGKLKQHPNDPGVNFEYAICLSYLGNLEEGRNTLKRVRTLDANFARNALPQYQDKHNENPNDPKITYRLAFLHYFNDEHEQALKLLGEVADAKPTTQLNAWALGYMAVVKGKQKKWSEAEALVQRALALEPDAYALHAALAVSLKGQGRYFAAMRAYLHALEKKREFDEYLKTLPSAMERENAAVQKAITLPVH